MKTLTKEERESRNKKALEGIFRIANEKFSKLKELKELKVKKK